MKVKECTLQAIRAKCEGRVNLDGGFAMCNLEKNGNCPYAKEVTLKKENK